MCPSYMVTREEKHSTRGRARLLFEMMTADVIHGRFREEAVKDALDLCLSCKGSKGECPVNVDMPPTRRSSSIIIMKDGSGRGRPTPWGSSTAGRASHRLFRAS
jgi:Fe-S oxidoreductase